MPVTAVLIARSTTVSLSMSKGQKQHLLFYLFHYARHKEEDSYRKKSSLSPNSSFSSAHDREVQTEEPAFLLLYTM